MAGPVDDDATSRLYDSSSEIGSPSQPTPPSDGTESVNVSNAPIHPMPSMQAAFSESIVESIEDQENPPDRGEKLDAKARRQKMIEQDEYDETFQSRWRRKPQAKYHPLWKLMAQISFGVHLLQQTLAKSDEEVVKILHKHVEEVDAYLEKATEDFDTAYMDILERINYLKLPLEHANIFDIMLDDKVFRMSIIDGNDKIEKIVHRTARAMNDMLSDAGKGLEAVAELAAYLESIKNDLAGANEQALTIYTAMRGNTEGWTHCLHALQIKGKNLGTVLVQLGNIVNEMSKRAGVASRRAVSSRGGETARRTSRGTMRSASPAIMAPTSRFSSASLANAKGKPLPRPPRPDSPATLRLETPNVLAHPPPSPRSPHSPYGYSPRAHSPLVGSPQPRSPQPHSPLVGSIRSQSSAPPSRQESAPFEGKFEQARAAPKPPIKKTSARELRNMEDEQAEEISALPQRPLGSVQRLSNTPQIEQPTSVKRSSSIMRRLSRSSQKEAPKSASQKHERSMTSDLADLFRVAGVADSPRNSRIELDSKPKNRLRKKSIDAMSTLLSPKGRDITQDKQTAAAGRDAKRSHSPAPDSAYSSGEGEAHTDGETPQRTQRNQSKERHSTDSQEKNANGGGSVKRNSLRAPPRPASPGPRRTMSIVSQNMSISSAQPHSSPAPEAEINPSLVRPQSPQIPRPQTPSQRGKFGLFPNSRPMTPTAASIRTDISPNASPLRQRIASAPLTPGKAGLDDGCPAPGVPRIRTYSNASGSTFKKGDIVGGAAVVEGRRDSAAVKPKGSFGRLRGWIGRKEKSSSRLRQVQE